MRPEYKPQNSLWATTYQEIVEKLQVENPPLFKDFDWAVPQPWLNEILAFSKAQHLMYIWVYDDNMHNIKGFPFPLSHLSQIALNIWYGYNEDLVMETVEEVDGQSSIWMQTEPTCSKFETFIFQSVKYGPLKTEEANLILDAMNYGWDETVRLFSPSYKETFTNLFEV